MMTTAIFDGYCVLCKQTKRIVTALDWFKRVEFLDVHQWSTVESRYPNLDFETAMGQIHVVSPDGKMLGGFEGMRRLLRDLPLTFPLWLLLNRSLSAGHIVLGTALALAIPLLTAGLRPLPVRIRKPGAVLRLALTVMADTSRSSLGVARVLLARGGRRAAAGAAPGGGGARGARPGAGAVRGGRAGGDAAHRLPSVRGPDPRG